MVKENASTPSAAKPSPSRRFSDTDIVADTITLSSTLMNEDSSIASLASVIRNEVSTLGPGDRLPSSRILMTRHKVSPLTVTRALARLTAEGLVVTRPGSGTFVAERRHRMPVELPDYGWQSMALGDRSIDASGVVELVTQPPDGVIALSGGYLAAELQPLQPLTASMKRAAGRVGSWERPPMAGLAELREWFARTSGTSARMSPSPAAARPR